METRFGLRNFYTRPEGPDTVLIRATNFVLPNLTVIGNGENVNWHVPIDDTHSWKYWIRASKHPIDREAVLAGRAELTPDYRLVRNKSNRYLQDREEMKTRTWSGLGKINQPQDACVLESAGPIQNREREHLGYSDRAIIAARQQLIRAIEDVQAGKDPAGVIRDPGRTTFRKLFGTSIRCCFQVL